MDAHPHSPRIMRTNKCRGVVRLDSLRDFGGFRNHPSFENAADPAARNILQSPVAYSCGVPALVEGHAGGFTSGRHHLGVLVGDIANRCCTVGVCVYELYLQTKEVEHVLFAPLPTRDCLRTNSLATILYSALRSSSPPPHILLILNLLVGQLFSNWHSGQWFSPGAAAN